MPSFLIEDQLCTVSSDHRIIVGVDEVGYGAIAGPVVAAAVYIPERGHSYIQEIQDSKALSPKKREVLFEQITKWAIYGLGFANVQEIEEHNILVASHMSMQRALSNLRINNSISLVLVDGSRIPKLTCSTKTKALVKGDSISTSIAAASIVAKVTRDRFMQTLHEQYPAYFWNRNYGYGTKAHILSLEKNGATPQHRRTFAPVMRAQQIPINSSSAKS